MTWLVTSARALSPLRLAHAYGVFPPQSPAPARMTPVAEVSWEAEVVRVGGPRDGRGVGEAAAALDPLVES